MISDKSTGPIPRDTSLLEGITDPEKEASGEVYIDMMALAPSPNAVAKTSDMRGAFV